MDPHVESVPFNLNQAMRIHKDYWCIMLVDECKNPFAVKIVKGLYKNCLRLGPTISHWISCNSEEKRANDLLVIQNALAFISSSYCAVDVALFPCTASPQLASFWNQYFSHFQCQIWDRLAHQHRSPHMQKPKRIHRSAVPITHPQRSMNKHSYYSTVDGLNPAPINR